MSKLIGTLLFCFLIFSVSAVEIEPQGGELIKNGGFENGGANWVSADIEASYKGTVYNSKWTTGIVTELDAIKGNTVITQTFDIWNGQVCIFTFNIAARTNVPLDSNKAIVYYNDIKLSDLAPLNYELASFKFFITLWSGTNSIAFQGAGTNEGLGLTLDNVSVKCPNSI